MSSIHYHHAHISHFIVALLIDFFIVLYVILHIFFRKHKPMFCCRGLFKYVQCKGGAVWGKGILEYHLWFSPFSAKRISFGARLMRLWLLASLVCSVFCINAIMFVIPYAEHPHEINVTKRIITVTIGINLGANLFHLILDVIIRHVNILTCQFCEGKTRKRLYRYGSKETWITVSDSTLCDELNGTTPKKPKKTPIKKPGLLAKKLKSPNKILESAFENALTPTPSKLDAKAKDVGSNVELNRFAKSIVQDVIEKAKETHHINSLIDENRIDPTTENSPEQIIMEEKASTIASTSNSDLSAGSRGAGPSPGGRGAGPGADSRSASPAPAGRVAELRKTSDGSQTKESSESQTIGSNKKGGFCCFTCNESEAGSIKPSSIDEGAEEPVAPVPSPDLSLAKSDSVRSPAGSAAKSDKASVAAKSASAKSAVSPAVQNASVKSAASSAAKSASAKSAESSAAKSASAKSAASSAAKSASAKSAASSAAKSASAKSAASSAAKSASTKSAASSAAKSASAKSAGIQSGKSDSIKSPAIPPAKSESSRSPGLLSWKSVKSKISSKGSSKSSGKSAAGAESPSGAKSATSIIKNTGGSQSESGSSSYGSDNGASITSAGGATAIKSNMSLSKSKSSLFNKKRVTISDENNNASSEDLQGFKEEVYELISRPSNSNQSNIGGQQEGHLEEKKSTKEESSSLEIEEAPNNDASGESSVTKDSFDNIKKVIKEDLIEKQWHKVEQKAPTNLFSWTPESLLPPRRHGLGPIASNISRSIIDMTTRGTKNYVNHAMEKLTHSQSITELLNKVDIPEEEEEDTGLFEMDETRKSKSVSFSSSTEKIQPLKQCATSTALLSLIGRHRALSITPRHLNDIAKETIRDTITGEGSQALQANMRSAFKKKLELFAVDLIDTIDRIIRNAMAKLKHDNEDDGCSEEIMEISSQPGGMVQGVAKLLAWQQESSKKFDSELDLLTRGQRTLETVILNATLQALAALVQNLQIPKYGTMTQNQPDIWYFKKKTLSIDEHSFGMLLEEVVALICKKLGEGKNMEQENATFDGGAVSSQVKNSPLGLYIISKLHRLSLEHLENTCTDFDENKLSCDWQLLVQLGSAAKKSNDEEEHMMLITKVAKKMIQGGLSFACDKVAEELAGILMSENQATEGVSPLKHLSKSSPMEKQLVDSMMEGISKSPVKDFVDCSKGDIVDKLSQNIKPMDKGLSWLYSMNQNVHFDGDILAYGCFECKSETSQPSEHTDPAERFPIDASSDFSNPPINPPLGETEEKATKNDNGANKKKGSNSDESDDDDDDDDDDDETSECMPDWLCRSENKNFRENSGARLSQSSETGRRTSLSQKSSGTLKGSATLNAHKSHQTMSFDDLIKEEIVKEYDKLKNGESVNDLRAKNSTDSLSTEIPACVFEEEAPKVPPSCCTLSSIATVFIFLFLSLNCLACFAGIVYFGDQMEPHTIHIWLLTVGVIFLKGVLVLEPMKTLIILCWQRHANIDTSKLNLPTYHQMQSLENVTKVSLTNRGFSPWQMKGK